jgi:hypothetical protein
VQPHDADFEKPKKKAEKKDDKAKDKDKNKDKKKDKDGAKGEDCCEDADSGCEFAIHDATTKHRQQILRVTQLHNDHLCYCSTALPSHIC